MRNSDILARLDEARVVARVLLKLAHEWVGGRAACRPTVLTVAAQKPIGVQVAQCSVSALDHIT